MNRVHFHPGRQLNGRWIDRSPCGAKGQRDKVAASGWKGVTCPGCIKRKPKA